MIAYTDVARYIGKSEENYSSHLNAYSNNNTLSRISQSCWLSSLHLHHLSLTSQHFYDHVLALKSAFEQLRHDTLCDGLRLKRRQNFKGPERLATVTKLGNKQVCYEEGPIEIGL